MPVELEFRAIVERGVLYAANNRGKVGQPLYKFSEPEMRSLATERQIEVQQHTNTGHALHARIYSGKPPFQAIKALGVVALAIVAAIFGQALQEMEGPVPMAE
jgi:hypothetical protein